MCWLCTQQEKERLERRIEILEHQIQTLDKSIERLNEKIRNQKAEMFRVIE